MLVMQQGSQHRVVSVTGSDRVCAGLFRQFRFLPNHVMIIYKGSHVRASGHFSQCVCQRVCQYSRAVSGPGSCIYIKQSWVASGHFSQCVPAWTCTSMVLVYNESVQGLVTPSRFRQCKRRVANIMSSPALTPSLPRYHLTERPITESEI